MDCLLMTEGEDALDERDFPLVRGRSFSGRLPLFIWMKLRYHGRRGMQYGAKQNLFKIFLKFV
ncbi:MAG: hypothetical protein EGQ34_04975 [Sutterella sp.]|nr:hypothetical protein [Sutterella sp.]